MIVDVSMYQTGVDLDTLPAHVDGVIIKATQGTYTDPAFASFVKQARAQPRWKYVGFYHFLSDKGARVEAQYFLDVITGLGGLRPGEFAVLDWENNAITGYSPPMSDAVAWMTIVDQKWPGRVAWYSYRSNAIKARQSGDFPWPLWLADPNPNGHDYALQLDAFLLQYGQEVFPPNIDVNELINVEVLDALTGDDMALSDDDVKRIAEAVWSRMIDSSAGATPAAQLVGYIYDEGHAASTGGTVGVIASEVIDELKNRL